MQRWIYYDYMGVYNPVCEDAGDITEIVPNIPAAPESYGNLDTIVADGIKFGCDCKKAILDYGGILFFQPYDPGRIGKTIFRELPAGIKHRDSMDAKPGEKWLDAKHSILTPICTDPRVLYIAHRGWMLGDSPGGDSVERWRQDIPTRQMALRWLLDNRKMTDCIPFDWLRLKIQHAEQQGEA